MEDTEKQSDTSGLYDDLFEMGGQSEATPTCKAHLTEEGASHLGMEVESVTDTDGHHGDDEATGDDLDLYEEGRDQRETTCDDLDLYDDIIQEEDSRDRQTMEEMAAKFEAAMATISRLEAENKSLHQSVEKLKASSENAKKNMSSMLLTARAEMSRKTSEITRLRKQLFNSSLSSHRGPAHCTSASGVDSPRRPAYSSAPATDVDTPQKQAARTGKQDRTIAERLSSSITSRLQDLSGSEQQDSDDNKRSHSRSSRAHKDKDRDKRHERHRSSRDKKGKDDTPAKSSGGERKSSDRHNLDRKEISRDHKSTKSKSTDKDDSNEKHDLLKRSGRSRSSRSKSKSRSQIDVDQDSLSSDIKEKKNMLAEMKEQKREIDVQVEVKEIGRDRTKQKSNSTEVSNREHSKRQTTDRETKKEKKSDKTRTDVKNESRQKSKTDKETENKQTVGSTKGFDLRQKLKSKQGLEAAASRDTVDENKSEAKTDIETCSKNHDKDSELLFKGVKKDLPHKKKNRNIDKVSECDREFISKILKTAKKDISTTNTRSAQGEEAQTFKERIDKITDSTEASQTERSAIEYSDVEFTDTIGDNLPQNIIHSSETAGIEDRRKVADLVKEACADIQNMEANGDISKHIKTSPVQHKPSYDKVNDERELPVENDMAKGIDNAFKETEFIAEKECELEFIVRDQSDSHDPDKANDKDMRRSARISMLEKNSVNSDISQEDVKTASISETKQTETDNLTSDRNKSEVTEKMTLKDKVNAISTKNTSEVHKQVNGLEMKQTKTSRRRSSECEKQRPVRGVISETISSITSSGEIDMETDSSPTAVAKLNSEEKLSPNRFCGKLNCKMKVNHLHPKVPKYTSPLKGKNLCTSPTQGDVHNDENLCEESNVSNQLTSESKNKEIESVFTSTNNSKPTTLTGSEPLKPTTVTVSEPKGSESVKDVGLQAPQKEMFCPEEVSMNSGSSGSFGSNILTERTRSPDLDSSDSSDSSGSEYTDSEYETACSGAQQNSDQEANKSASSQSESNIFSDTEADTVIKKAVSKTNILDGSKTSPDTKQTESSKENTSSSADKWGDKVKSCLSKVDDSGLCIETSGNESQLTLNDITQGIELIPAVKETNKVKQSSESVKPSLSRKTSPAKRELTADNVHSVLTESPDKSFLLQSLLCGVESLIETKNNNGDNSRTSAKASPDKSELKPENISKKSEMQESQGNYSTEREALETDLFGSPLSSDSSDSSSCSGSDSDSDSSSESSCTASQCSCSGCSGSSSSYSSSSSSSSGRESESSDSEKEGEIQKHDSETVKNQNEQALEAYGVSSLNAVKTAECTVEDNTHKTTDYNTNHFSNSAETGVSSNGAASTHDLNAEIVSPCVLKISKQQKCLKNESGPGKVEKENRSEIQDKAGNIPKDELEKALLSQHCQKDTTIDGMQDKVSNNNYVIECRDQLDKNSFHAKAQSMKNNVQDNITDHEQISQIGKETVEVGANGPSVNVSLEAVIKDISEEIPPHIKKPDTKSKVIEANEKTGSDANLVQSSRYEKESSQRENQTGLAKTQQSSLKKSSSQEQSTEKRKTITEADKSKHMLSNSSRKGNENVKEIVSVSKQQNTEKHKTKDCVGENPSETNLRSDKCSDVADKHYISKDKSEKLDSKLDSIDKQCGDLTKGPNIMPKVTDKEALTKVLSKTSRLSPEKTLRDVTSFNLDSYKIPKRKPACVQKKLIVKPCEDKNDDSLKKNTRVNKNKVDSTIGRNTLCSRNETSVKKEITELKKVHKSIKTEKKVTKTSTCIKSRHNSRTRIKPSLSKEFISSSGSESDDSMRSSDSDEISAFSDRMVEAVFNKSVSSTESHKSMKYADLCRTRSSEDTEDIAKHDIKVTKSDKKADNDVKRKRVRKISSDTGSENTSTETRVKSKESSNTDMQDKDGSDELMSPRTHSVHLGRKLVSQLIESKSLEKKANVSNAKEKLSHRPKENRDKNHSSQKDNVKNTESHAKGEVSGDGKVHSDKAISAKLMKSKNNKNNGINHNAEHFEKTKKQLKNDYKQERTEHKSKISKDLGEKASLSNKQSSENNKKHGITKNAEHSEKTKNLSKSDSTQERIEHKSKTNTDHGKKTIHLNKQSFENDKNSCISEDAEHSEKTKKHLKSDHTKVRMEHKSETRKDHSKIASNVEKQTVRENTVIENGYSVSIEATGKDTERVKHVEKEKAHDKNVSILALDIHADETLDFLDISECHMTASESETDRDSGSESDSSSCSSSTSEEGEISDVSVTEQFKRSPVKPFKLFQENPASPNRRAASQVLSAKHRIGTKFSPVKFPSSPGVELKASKRLDMDVVEEHTPRHLSRADKRKYTSDSGSETEPGSFRRTPRSAHKSTRRYTSPRRRDRSDSADRRYMHRMRSRSPKRFPRRQSRSVSPHHRTRSRSVSPRYRHEKRKSDYVRDKRLETARRHRSSSQDSVERKRKLRLTPRCRKDRKHLKTSNNDSYYDRAEQRDKRSARRPETRRRSPSYERELSDRQATDTRVSVLEKSYRKIEPGKKPSMVERKPHSDRSQRDRNKSGDSEPERHKSKKSLEKRENKSKSLNKSATKSPVRVARREKEVTSSKVVERDRSLSDGEQPVSRGKGRKRRHFRSSTDYDTDSDQSSDERVSTPVVKKLRTDML